MRISDWSSDVCSSDLAGSGSQTTRNLYLNPAARSEAVAAPECPFVERSDERRVGKECASTCRSRWWPYHSKNKITHAHMYLLRYQKQSYQQSDSYKDTSLRQLISTHYYIPQIL